MNEITPEQKKQLETWGEQRDAILREISVANEEKEILISSNKSLAESNTDLETRINQNKGRLEVLEQTEKELINSLPKELSELLVKISSANSTLTSLEKTISVLIERKEDLKQDIKVLAQLHSEVYARATMIDKIVDTAIRVNTKNTDTVNKMVDTLKNNIVEMETSLKSVHSTVIKESQELHDAVAASTSANANNVKIIKETMEDIKDKAVEIGAVNK